MSLDDNGGPLALPAESSSELADLLGQAMDSGRATLWADNAAQSVADLSWSALFDKAERLSSCSLRGTSARHHPGDHL